MITIPTSIRTRNHLCATPTGTSTNRSGTPILTGRIYIIATSMIDLQKCPASVFLGWLQISNRILPLKDPAMITAIVSLH